MAKTKAAKKPAPADAKLDQPVGLKATPEQVSSWERAAISESRTLSNWIRTVLDRAAGAAS